MKFLNKIDGADKIVTDSNNRLVTDVKIAEWDSKANGAHEHSTSDIQDFPTSLPANGGNADTVGGFTVGINVPANAKFTDTVYTHPTTAGNKHIPTGGVSGQFLKWSASGTAVWAADNNTTYSVATSTTNGLLSSADKTKLDSVASNSNNSLISTTQPTTQSIGDIWFVEVLR